MFFLRIIYTGRVDAEEYRKKIERDILKILEEKLLIGQMDADRAKAIARLVLDKLHPPLTLEQIHSIAPTLDDEFSELSKAVLPIMNAHDEEIKSTVLQHVEKLIGSGKLDEAYKELKEATVGKDN